MDSEYRQDQNQTQDQEKDEPLTQAERLFAAGFKPMDLDSTEMFETLRQQMQKDGQHPPRMVECLMCLVSMECFAGEGCDVPHVCNECMERYPGLESIAINYFSVGVQWAQNSIRSATEFNLANMNRLIERLSEVQGENNLLKDEAKSAADRSLNLQFECQILECKNEVLDKHAQLSICSTRHLSSALEIARWKAARYNVITGGSIVLTLYLLAMLVWGVK